jgi:hypothetical protein
MSWREYRDPRAHPEATPSGAPERPGDTPDRARVTPTIRTCVGRHEPASVDELLEVVEIRTGVTFWVHRPIGQRPCFRWKVMSAAQHRVVPASQRHD